VYEEYQGQKEDELAKNFSSSMGHSLVLSRTLRDNGLLFFFFTFQLIGKELNKIMYLVTNEKMSMKPNHCQRRLEEKRIRSFEKYTFARSTFEIFQSVLKSQQIRCSR